MKKIQFFFIAIFLLFVQLVQAQKEMQIIDSLKKEYNKTSDLTRKASIAGELAAMHMAVNIDEANKWGNLALEQAEISRSKKSIVEANIINGVRFVSNSGLKENIDKAKTFFEAAIDIAQKNNLDKLLSESYLYLSKVYRILSEYDKALANTTLANSIAVSIKNDSLLAACNLSFGSCYFWKGDKITALRNYFEANTIAERVKNEQLTRSCNASLISFYASIKNFDKAIDFAYNNLYVARASKNPDFQYYIVNDLLTIGNLYSSQNKYELAKSFFEQSIKKGDSINMEILKFQGYAAIFNMYLKSNEPQKALAYFKSQPNMIKTFNQLGYGSSVDYAYAYAFVESNQIDSAEFYLKRAAPFFENQVASTKISFKTIYAKFFNKKGDMPSSIEKLKEALNIAESNKELNSIVDVAKLLDSAYQKTGDYKEAFFYANLYTKVKDSLDKMGKEDQILQLQIVDEEKRKERILKEEEEKIKKRNSIQYLAIVIAIVMFFVGLVMMGLFKVSENTIKILGFFSFIMLFEFLFLIFKKSIHQFTNGEPWKDLTAMILIAAILVPLHHWLEHKVIKYLSSQEMISLKGKRINWLPKILTKNKPVH